MELPAYLHGSIHVTLFGFVLPVVHKYIEHAQTVLRRASNARHGKDVDLPRLCSSGGGEELDVCIALTLDSPGWPCAWPLSTREWSAGMGVQACI